MIKFLIADRLREMGLFSLEKTLGRPCSGLPVLEGGLQESWGEIFLKRHVVTGRGETVLNWKSVDLD